MTASNTYAHHTNTIKEISLYRSKRLLLLCTVLLFGIPSFAQDAPSFVLGPSQVIGGCENITGAAAAGSPLNSVMAVNDPITGRVDTLKTASGPLHGTLAGFPFFDTTTGGTVTPTGLAYIPDSGYIGADSFIIEVIDPSADIAFITVTVNSNMPPTLSSTLTPPAICDNTTFYYSPTSATGGATFAWHRSSSIGVLPIFSESGVGNVNEVLGNTTFYNVSTTYVYTVTAGGCTGPAEHVTVTIKPTPVLASPTTDTVCSGGVVNYIPASLTSGTTYTWARAGVAGISPDTSTGSGNINEALTNSLSTPVTVLYNFALAANGCTSSDNVYITVNPQPSTPITSITTSPVSSICAGTSFQNFGASIPAPSGVTYTWSATNANIYHTGPGGQYILVNFPNAGNAVVTLSYAEAGTNCVINDNYTVTVGTGTSSPGYVLYDNYQFVFTDNTVDSYQWGYDNTTTLDSTIIPGATFQSYVNGAPDYIDNYYWVLTTKNGCMQKTYFNAPSAVTNINREVTIKVYPNPAANTVNIDLGNAQGNAATVDIANMLGQNVNTQTVTAGAAQVDITALPPGCYIISCLQDGVKIASARLIKN